MALIIVPIGMATLSTGKLLPNMHRSAPNAAKHSSTVIGRLSFSESSRANAVSVANRLRPVLLRISRELQREAIEHLAVGLGGDPVHTRPAQPVAGKFLCRGIEDRGAGAFRVTRRAAKGMLRLKRGRIVFVSSVVGLSGSAGQANYAASKAGLVGFARSVARELGSRSITANVVAPGFVDTDMTAELDDERKAAIVGQVPLARYATPDEIAGVITFLAGDAAGYITGAVVPVDGGLGM